MSIFASSFTLQNSVFRFTNNEDYAEEQRTLHYTEITVIIRCTKLSLILYSRIQIRNSISIHPVITTLSKVNYSLPLVNPDRIALELTAEN
jgi:hypothetical protein